MSKQQQQQQKTDILFFFFIRYIIMPNTGLLSSLIKFNGRFGLGNQANHQIQKLRNIEASSASSHQKLDKKCMSSAPNPVHESQQVIKIRCIKDPFPN